MAPEYATAILPDDNEAAFTSLPFVVDNCTSVPGVSVTPDKLNAWAYAYDAVSPIHSTTDEEIGYSIIDPLYTVVVLTVAPIVGVVPLTVMALSEEYDALYDRASTKALPTCTRSLKGLEFDAVATLTSDPTDTLVPEMDKTTAISVFAAS